jgi:hypothetical protein
MADKKISALTKQLVEPASGDLFPFTVIGTLVTKVIEWQVIKSIFTRAPREAEINFSTSGYSGKFTVVDADVLPTHKIVVAESAAAPTGKAADEHEFDQLMLSAVAGTGQFTVYAQAVPGPVAGKFKINYTFN